MMKGDSDTIGDGGCFIIVFIVRDFNFTNNIHGDRTMVLRNWLFDRIYEEESTAIIQ